MTITEKLFVKWINMYRLFLVAMSIIITSFIQGCSGAKTSVPPKHKFTTVESKVCAHTCQSINANCEMECSQMNGGIPTDKQQRKCQNKCNQTLSDCYSNCQ